MKFKLSNGNEIPLVGFGTWLISGRSVETILDHALTAGYRLFDTATMYENEEDMGKALQTLLPKHNLSREDIFITTKLYPDDHGDKAAKAIEISLKKLNCGYIDLYLIHWPGVYGIRSSSPENAILRDKSWQHMVQAVHKGLIKNIGVSNYAIHHLKQLLLNDHGIKPVVNQMEWHPYCYQSDLLDFCCKKEILLQAYMPLGGTNNQDLLNNTKVIKIAERHRKTTAQILLRWSIQHNVAVIPKSKSRDHIFNNINLDFVLSEEDMHILNNFKEIRRYDWDPNTIT